MSLLLLLPSTPTPAPDPDPENVPAPDISAAAIQAAVEQYLPRTLNYAKSADLGEKDQAALFQRITQVLLTALLRDQNAVYYLIYLNAQRYLDALNAAISTANTLAGDQQLQLSEAADATDMSDTSGLDDATRELTQLSARLAAGKSFGTNLTSQFETAVTGYLTEHVKPNVVTKNKARVRADVLKLAADLNAQWDLVQERREQLYEILTEYDDADLASLAAKYIISAVDTKIDEIKTTLEEESTEVTAADAEQILIELAAGMAVLKVIAEPPEVVGTRTGEASDAATSSEYKVEEGTARTEPVTSVLRGEEGKLSFTAISTGTAGRAYDDADSDDLTFIFGEVGADFAGDGVAEGYFLTFAETGRTHRIEEVSYGGDVKKLKVSPEIAITLDGAKYFITELPVGVKFTDTSVSFWTEYSGEGFTGSTQVMTGSNGSVTHVPKASGSDGSNLRAEGTTSGNMYVTVDSGSAGAGTIATDIWTDATATFVTNGVEPGDILDINSGTETHVIASIISETQLALETTLAASWGPTAPWTIEPPSDVLVDASATFLTDEVQVGDLVRGQTYLDTPGAAVTAVLSETRLEIDYDTGSTARTSFSYEVRFQTDEFQTDSGYLQSADIQPGDTLEFTSGPYTYSVDAVSDQEILTVTTTWTTNPSPGFDGESWEVYEDNTTSRYVVITDVIDLEDANSVNAGRFGDGATDPPVGPILEYPAGSGRFRTVFLRLDPTGSPEDHDIGYLDLDTPASELWLLESADVQGPVAWHIYAGELTPIFTDTTNSPFASVVEGDVLVYDVGLDSEQKVRITEVVSADEVKVDPELPHDSINRDYALMTPVRPGMELLCGGRRVTIVDVLDENTLLVSPPLPIALGTNVEWQVVTPGIDARTTRLTRTTGEWADESVGQVLDIFGDTQVRATIRAIEDLDGDGLEEVALISSQMNIGRRSVSWRLLSQAELTSFEMTGTVDVDDVADGDVLTVWGYPGLYEVTAYAETPDTITFTPALPSGVEGLEILTHTGGSLHWGRYYLLEQKDAALTLDEDLDLLELRLAEVLSDFGGTLEEIVATTTPTVMSSDADGLVLTDETADFVTDGILVGDRIRVTIGTTIYTRYIDTVTTTSLTLGIGTEEGTVTEYEVGRNSISYAMEEALRLRDQLSALRDVVQSYTVPVVQVVRDVLDMLKDQGMSRARELLLDGEITEFLSLSASGASYEGAAKEAIQSAGASMSSTTEARSNVSGTDPTTGESIASTSYSVVDDAVSPDQEVDSIVALAEMSQALAGSERVQAAASISLDEVRNRAIYELTGEVETDVVDDQDATLPWLSRIGSKKDRTLQDKERSVASIDYILDNEDLFEEAEDA